MFIDAELNFSFFVYQVMTNLQWPSEKELILYKIFLNKESLTDRSTAETLSEREGVVGGYWSQWPYG